MGINSNTYNTFADDMAARQEAILIRRNLMGMGSPKKRRKKKGGASFVGNEKTADKNYVDISHKSMPIDKTFKKEEDKRDKTIDSLQNELEKLKSQNTRAVESSHRNTGSFWTRNKKDIMDAVIVLGILYIGYKMFFDKKEVSQNAMGGEVAGAEMGGEVEI
tara:strand:+ start:2350 stop:2835 length:486 start_codon:yes stop_codon:yes gene_type:complete